MAAMLAEKYDLIHCGENYHLIITNGIATPAEYPNLCYFETYVKQLLDRIIILSDVQMGLSYQCLLERKNILLQLHSVIFFALNN